MTRLPRREKVIHLETTQGPLCPFHRHSLLSQTGRISRYVDTQACVQCVRELPERVPHLDPQQIHPSWRARYLEFWSLVEIRGADECWPWHGRWDRASGLISPWFSLKRHWGAGHEYSVGRVAAWFSWGDVARLRVKTTCGSKGCANPWHQRIVDLPHFYHKHRKQVLRMDVSTQEFKQLTRQWFNELRNSEPDRFDSLRAADPVWVSGSSFFRSS